MPGVAGTELSTSGAHHRTSEARSDHLRVQPLGPTYAAYGAVLELLARFAPFAGFRLDQASAIVRAQLKSGNHVAVFTPDDQLVGYLGWIYTSSTAAELWLQDQGELEPTSSGDALAVTVVVSTIPAATEMMAARCRKLHRGYRAYFQRLYKDRPPRKHSVLERR